MAELTIQDINDLDPDDVAQAESFLVDFLKGQFPSLDLTQGRVLRDLLILPAAIFHALNQENFDRLRRSQSMLEIAKDPTLADDDIVDAVLSNYRITRDAGEKATGLATIVIENRLTTPIQQGTIFTANGLTFTTDAAFVGVTTAAAVISEAQRLILPRNDGLFSFAIPVVATDAGEQFLLRRNTRLTVDPAPAGLVDALAAEDFTGGRNTETNAELVERFKLELSPKVFSGRIHIEALLRDALADLKDTSITGFGDAEMLRDRHNIFSTSTGGKADLYTRTQSLPESRTIVKTATLINAATQLWQVTLVRDDVPGFYLVERVLPENAASDQGSFVINSEVRGLDLSQLTNEFVPDVDNLIEGAYSRYQTAVVQFTDPDTDTTGLVENESTKDYNVDVLGMPNVDTLQDLAIDRASRNPNADYLVRAPIPAFMAVSFSVQHLSSIAAPSKEDIAQAVADRVNGVGFELGKIPASIIHDAIHDVIGRSGTLAVSPLDMVASIRKPAGTFLEIRDGNELVVPELPAEGVTNRTVIFYLPVTAVDVAVEQVEALPV